VCWKPCSSCWSLHLLREEFLSAPIHSPLSSSPYWSFISQRIGRDCHSLEPNLSDEAREGQLPRFASCFASPTPSGVSPSGYTRAREGGRTATAQRRADRDGVENDSGSGAGACGGRTAATQRRADCGGAAQRRSRHGGCCWAGRGGAEEVPAKRGGRCCGWGGTTGKVRGGGGGGVCRRWGAPVVGERREEEGAPMGRRGGGRRSTRAEGDRWGRGR
jgi:hypothetical protein